MKGDIFMAKPSKSTDGVKRDARINLAFTVGLKNRLEDLASIDGVSTNALIEKICMAHVESRAADIEAFAEFRARLHNKKSANAEK